MCNATENELETTNKKLETKVGRHAWLFRYVPLLLWIGVIFLLSSGQGSMSQTSRIIRPILEFLFPTAAPETLLYYHGVIRKLAHFTEYAVLALLACRAFTTWDRFRYTLALGLVLLVASIDETQQSFNAARTGSVYDVLLDAAGGLSVIFISLIWDNRAARRKRICGES